MFKIVNFAHFIANLQQIRPKFKKYWLFHIYPRRIELLIFRKQHFSYTTEKALYENVENTLFRHIRPDCQPLRLKPKKQLSFTKIQTIFQIHSKSQNFMMKALGSQFFLNSGNSCLTAVNQMTGKSWTELTNGIARSRISLLFIPQKCSTPISFSVQSLQNVKIQSHHPLKFNFIFKEYYE